MMALLNRLRGSLAASAGKPDQMEPEEGEVLTLKGLAHPKRLLILDLLGHDELNVSDLVQLTRLAQSDVSQNLAVMRAAGLVLARRDGVHTYYRVRDARVHKAVALLRAAMAA